MYCCIVCVYRTTVFFQVFFFHLSVKPTNPPRPKAKDFVFLEIFDLVYSSIFKLRVRCAYICMCCDFPSFPRCLLFLFSIILILIPVFFLILILITVVTWHSCYPFYPLFWACRWVTSLRSASRPSNWQRAPTKLRPAEMSALGCVKFNSAQGC